MNGTNKQKMILMKKKPNHKMNGLFKNILN